MLSVGVLLLASSFVVSMAVKHFGFISMPALLMISTVALRRARSEYYPAHPGLSLNATLLGEAQMSFGIVGQVAVFPIVTLGTCLLWLAILSYERPSQPILVVLGLVYALVLFRSELMNPSLSLGFQALAIVWLEKLPRALRLGHEQRSRVHVNIHPPMRNRPDKSSADVP